MDIAFPKTGSVRPFELGVKRLHIPGLLQTCLQTPANFWLIIQQVHVTVEHTLVHVLSCGHSYLSPCSCWLLLLTTVRTALSSGELAKENRPHARCSPICIGCLSWLNQNFIRYSPLRIGRSGPIGWGIVGGASGEGTRDGKGDGWWW